MADKLERKFPKGSLRITTGCQYCAVGCGYNAFLSPSEECDGEETFDGVSRFITPAMRGKVNYKGETYHAAVAPDARCDLNKGNHSVRGGSQGHNLVSPEAGHRSTKDRLLSPQVRIRRPGKEPELVDITWPVLNEVMARLVASATKMKTIGSGRNKKIAVENPGGLGVKVFEYQYLENTFAATKLFYSAIGTPNVAFHDRPSAAGSSPALKDAGMRPHDFAYEDIRESDVILMIGTNPYENQSVFFMQYCQGKQIVVIDPRETATAQYAKQTGGAHVPLKNLGGDSLICNALSRAILEETNNGVLGWLRQREASADIDWSNRRYGDMWRLARQSDIEGIGSERSYDKRRRSRVLTLDQYLGFLWNGESKQRYSLENAATIAGHDDSSQLEGLVEILAAKRDFQELDGSTTHRRPKVAILYEKGVIWGFNYENIAAIGSLGIVLGAYSEPGKLVGRVGGHQKGWANSKADLSGVFDSSSWICETDLEKKVDYSEGYPFRNASDSYVDENLEEVYGKERFEKCKLASEYEAAGEIQLQHNLDLHVFGTGDLDVVEESTYKKKKFVRLENGVRTLAKPDVSLLWIIGGNYFGQTNDAETKRKKLDERLLVKGSRGKRKLPTAATVDKIVAALSERICAENGLVVVHQEMFSNPSTDYADIIIPAAGWGEDDFIRYNAQRRIRLYARFQDPPLHEKDQSKLEKLNKANQKDDPNAPAIDPVSKMRDPRIWAHSPKPDWLIFRDVGVAIGACMDSESSDFFKDKLSRNKKAEYWKADVGATSYFDWESSAEVADDMAIWSQRGLASADACGTSMLGDLYLHGISAGIEPTEKLNDGILHRLLGIEADGNPHPDAQLSPELTTSTESNTPSYSIPGQSAVHGNGIATNGVLLPIYGVNESGDLVITEIKTDKLLDNEKVQRRIDEIVRVVGSLNVDRAKLEYIRRYKNNERIPLGAPFFFVMSCWEKIEPHFNRINKIGADRSDTLLVTNGRFNHLWNNMFHHIRNEYVNKRWPSDLPGTIVEINPDWAKKNGRDIDNGQVVELSNERGTCRGIASLQDWVVEGHAFLMFSYPVKEDGKWSMSGYANNLTDGYFEGIHPIAAVKFSHAELSKVETFPGSGKHLVYPDDYGVDPKMGITFEQRNRVAVDRTNEQRADWQMRELIVQKGLPRAFLKRQFDIDGVGHGHGPKGRFWDFPTFEEFEDYVDRNFGSAITLTEIVKTLVDPEFARMPDGMLVPPDFKDSSIPPALKRDLHQIEKLTHEIEASSSASERNKKFGQLKQRLDNLIDFPHRALVDFFAGPDRYIKLLRDNKRVASQFSLRLSNDSTNLRRMVWLSGENVIDDWFGTDLEFSKSWLKKNEETVVGTEEDKMIQLIKDRTSEAAGIGSHSGVTFSGSTLKELFEVGDKHDEILQLLLNIEASGGGRLVEPGDAGNSKFYELITTGGMSADFDNVQREIVKDWINSLPQDFEAAMIQLIKDKTAAAAGVGSHSSVSFGGNTLNDLFEAGDKHDEVLQLLLNADSSGGDKLVIAGDPDNSEFYKLITTGGMSGRFNSAEREIVKQWIANL